jgi:hypothetical protein
MTSKSVIASETNESADVGSFNEGVLMLRVP